MKRRGFLSALGLGLGGVATRKYWFFGSLFVPRDPEFHVIPATLGPWSREGPTIEMATAILKVDYEDIVRDVLNSSHVLNLDLNTIYDKFNGIG